MRFEYLTDAAPSLLKYMSAFLIFIDCSFINTESKWWEIIGSNLSYANYDIRRGDLPYCSDTTAQKVCLTKRACLNPWVGDCTTLEGIVVFLSYTNCTFVSVWLRCPDEIRRRGPPSHCLCHRCLSVILICSYYDRPHSSTTRDVQNRFFYFASVFENQTDLVRHEFGSVRFKKWGSVQILSLCTTHVTA